MNQSPPAETANAPTEAKPEDKPSGKVSVTFTGDPMRDGQKKLTGFRFRRRWDDEQDKEIVIKRPLFAKHKADNPETTTMGGETFELGKKRTFATDSDFWKEFGAKIAGNSHFKTTADDDFQREMPKDKGQAVPVYAGMIDD